MINLNKEPTWFDSVVREIADEKETISILEGGMQDKRRGREERASSIPSTKGVGGIVFVSLWRSTMRRKGKQSQVEHQEYDGYNEKVG